MINDKLSNAFTSPHHSRFDISVIFNSKRLRPLMKAEMLHSVLNNSNDIKTQGNNVET